MISRTTEYALRAAVCLAVDPAEPKTTQQISRVSHVPAGYLAKVMQSLVRAGVVGSQRGLGGGFILKRPPREITVLDVVNAVDPVKRILECPLGLPEHQDGLCPLHRKLDQAAAQIESSFASSTLADLVKPSKRQTPLCRPKAAAGRSAKPRRVKSGS